MSDPEFYGWSDEDVRDVFEVSRELGLSDVEKRQRVNGRFADRDKAGMISPRLTGEPMTYRDPAGDTYRMRGFMRPEVPRAGAWEIGATSVDAGSPWFTDEGGNAITPIGVRAASGESIE